MLFVKVSCRDTGQVSRKTSSLVGLSLQITDLDTSKTSIKLQIATLAKDLS